MSRNANERCGRRVRSPSVAATGSVRPHELDRGTDHVTRICWTAALLASWPAFAHADDWPQWLGDKRDGVWRENGILDKFPKDGPKALWRVPVGKGYSGPAVVGDRVFVMDRVRATDKQG